MSENLKSLLEQAEKWKTASELTDISEFEDWKMRVTKELQSSHRVRFIKLKFYEESTIYENSYRDDIPF